MHGRKYREGWGGCILPNNLPAFPPIFMMEVESFPYELIYIPPISKNDQFCLTIPPMLNIDLHPWQYALNACRTGSVHVPLGCIVPGILHKQ